MKYNDFLETVQEHVKSMVEPEFSVSIQPIQKNNGVVYDGLTFINPSCNISPTIYLNHYYHRYLDGVSIEDICEDIMNTYKEHAPKHSANVDLFTKFENCKSKIVMKLINYDQNIDFLKDTPHFKYLDFAIIFQILVDYDKQNNASITIKNNLLLIWDITKDDLYDEAIINMPRLLPHKLDNIVDVLKRQNPLIELKPEKLFVLTNYNFLNGATSILYPGLLEEISNKFDSDLILLPSSIHEFLIVPSDSIDQMMNYDKLIQDVNSTQLTDSEILSDHSYYYSREKKQLMMPEIVQEDIIQEDIA